MPIWLRSLTREMKYNESGNRFRRYSISFDASRNGGCYAYDEGGGGEVELISCADHPDGGKVAVFCWRDTSGSSAGDRGMMTLHFHGTGASASPSNGASRSHSTDYWSALGFSPSSTTITGAWWSEVNDALGRERDAQRRRHLSGPGDLSASVGVIKHRESAG